MFDDSESPAFSAKPRMAVTHSPFFEAAISLSEDLDETSTSYSFHVLLLALCQRDGISFSATWLSYFLPAESFPFFIPSLPRIASFDLVSL